MRRFSGRGGEVFFASDLSSFDSGMEDCGDGFDWRITERSLSYWIPDEGVRFWVWEAGEWAPLEPLLVQHASGRADFGRCLAGMAVRAEGYCRPLTIAGEGVAWRLEVASFTPASNELGDDDDNARFRTVMGSADAALEGFALADAGMHLNGDPLVVRLPIGSGQLVGFGYLADTDGSQVHIRFEQGSVCYVH